ncbi:MAG TPA: hypothetical protein VF911_11505 [Thermoanaerobaculia bacterium]|jgi:hypothetical protein
MGALSAVAAAAGVISLFLLAWLAMRGAAPKESTNPHAPEARA